MNIIIEKNEELASDTVLVGQFEPSDMKTLDNLMIDPFDVIDKHHFAGRIIAPLRSALPILGLFDDADAWVKRGLALASNNVIRRLIEEEALELGCTVTLTDDIVIDSIRELYHRYLLFIACRGSVDATDSNGDMYPIYLIAPIYIEWSVNPPDTETLDKVNVFSPVTNKLYISKVSELKPGDILLKG